MTYSKDLVITLIILRNNKLKNIKQNLAISDANYANKEY